jgi:DNA-binding transcriptional MerR regulator
MMELNNLINEEHKRSKKDFKDKYFIKDIETLTGIKANTLRIWEQRYAILEPKRTDTNIRYYEEDDLKYIMNIAVLNSHGFKISKLAGMCREDVQKLTQEHQDKCNEFHHAIQSLSRAMTSFDEREFNRVLSIQILNAGMEATIQDVIFPFLNHIGVLWTSGSINVAHEHFVSNLLRQKLYVAIDQLGVMVHPSADRFLLFVPDGDNHDLGLLIASYLLRAHGQHVVFLGKSTPIDDISQIYKVHRSEIMMCSITNSMKYSTTENYVKTVAKMFPDAQFWVTGGQAMGLDESKLPGNCRIFRSIQGFTELIEARKKLKSGLN